MQYKIAFVPLALTAVSFSGSAQDKEPSQNVPLSIAAGTPLRLYLTKRISKRAGEPVEAKLLDPLFSFDREVAPAGSTVEGAVARVKPVSRMERAMAILGGDFTPLHQAEVEFTTLTLPDGTRIPLNTVETPGMNSIANLHPKKPAASSNKNAGVLGTAKAQMKDKIATTRQRVSDVVRAPGKKERLEDYLWAKLPYHPQYVRRGTRFDAELAEPLQFGAATIQPEDVRALGTQPPADSMVQARLTTTLSSDSSKQGEPVDAVTTRPLFSPDHKLFLPEGTHLKGQVTMVQRAKWFHRGGQLRFNFQTVELSEEISALQSSEDNRSFKTVATLGGAEQDGNISLKVDQEGGVKATEPKTRFIAPALAFFVAQKAADNDVNKITGLPKSNTGGHVLGGGSGFGLLGAAAAKASPSVARAFGYYGLAWSVFRNVIARGREVEFQKNAAIDVRFGGAPGSSSGSKLKTAKRETTATEAAASDVEINDVPER
ncbi:MAG: hypothetical protein JO307_06650 [Bryobacterales bacterium]|nr:hypothetical protein [Bryobacterales bacterium]MBV9398134.1 hypothetical protein [Bryobacterales bacterium]